MKQAVRYRTGFSSEIGTKLRKWAVGQAEGSCYSRAALSSNDSKTLIFVSFPSLLAVAAWLKAAGLVIQ